MSSWRGIAAVVLGAALWAGCVSVDYVGKSYPPTASVELFMTPDDVKRPYEVIGEARAQVDALPFSNPAEQLQQKLLLEAQNRGANAVILGSITTRHDERRIREIRAQSKVLVTIGACATAGGVQALRNFADVAEFASVVYAKPEYIDTLATSTPASMLVLV